MKKTLSQIIFAFAFGIFGGIFANQILWPYLIEKPLFYKYRLETNPIYVTERKEVTIQENQALKESIEKVKRIVVGVRTKMSNGKLLEGSGLVLTSDGLVVTLARLVPQGETFSFFVDGKPSHYQVLKRDLKKDLALIKIEKDNLSTAGFFNLDKLNLGERVFLVGNVFDKNTTRKIVNEGIVEYFDNNLIKTNIMGENNLLGSPIFDIGGNILGLSVLDKTGKVVVLPVSEIKLFTGL